MNSNRSALSQNPSFGIWRRWIVALALLSVALGIALRADVCDSHWVLDGNVEVILSKFAKERGDPLSRPLTLTAAHKYAKEVLARPSQSERSDARAVEHYHRLLANFGPEDLRELRAAFQGLGFLTENLPTQVKCDYILIHGATVGVVRDRVMAIAQAIDRGNLQLSPGAQVIFLDGERPRFSTETDSDLIDPAPYRVDPNWVAPLELPDDERAICEMVWSQLKLPAALRKKAPLFVHARKREGATRADTEDTLKAWLEIARPSGGIAIMASNNPFIEYQRRTTQLILTRLGLGDLQVIAMGPAASFSAHSPTVKQIGLLLDTLAITLNRAEQQRQLPSPQSAAAAS